MLYHCDIGLPAGASLPIGMFPLHYTSHALEQACKRIVAHLLPRELDTARAKLVEAELGASGGMVKAVVRINLDDFRDLCLAIAFDTFPLTVKTLWINRKGDNHKTLDRSRYGSIEQGRINRE